MLVVGFDVACKRFRVRRQFERFACVLTSPGRTSRTQFSTHTSAEKTRYIFANMGNGRQEGALNRRRPVSRIYDLGRLRRFTDIPQPNPRLDRCGPIGGCHECGSGTPGRVKAVTKAIGIIAQGVIGRAEVRLMTRKVDIRCTQLPQRTPTREV